MKKSLLLLVPLLLTGCISSTLDKTDSVLEKRLRQVETSVSAVKSEAIAEAREAAADLVEEATEKLEASGKEVISHAAKEAGTVAEVTLEKAKNDIREILSEDVPKAVEESIVRSADKIAERLGATPRVVPNPDGSGDLEVWATGGGLLGLLGVVFTFVRNYLNSRAGKSRWSEEDIKRIAKSS